MFFHLKPEKNVVSVIGKFFLVGPGNFCCHFVPTAWWLLSLNWGIVLPTELQNQRAHYGPIEATQQKLEK